MNTWFWVSMILLLYLAGALWFSVILEIAMKKDLAAKNFRSVEELGSVAIWLCYGSLFWPLSIIKWQIQEAKEKRAKRKSKRDLKELNKRIAKDMRLAERKAKGK